MLQYPYRSPLWLPFDTGRALWAGQKEAPMERPVSRMLAIPSQVTELNDLQRLCRRLEQAKGFQLKAAHLGDAFCSLELSSQGQAYTLSLYLTPFGIPPLYRCQHYFPDVDAEELEAREQGLAVEMTFGPDPLASYHLQLQVIHTLLSDTLAVMDDSSEKLLSGRWVALAAASHIPPAPRYIYTVQAVSGDESDCVWLHTHGLNRCGITELEVLDSSEGIELISEGGDENPHVWVSITDCIQQVENIAEGLAQADPDHALEYLENAQEYEAKLSVLRGKMHEELDDLPNRDIVTFHEAFPYFAQEFNLRIVQVVNREPDSQPSAKEMADTIRLIRETGVKAVFAEPQYPESAANVIAEESGASFYFLDPAVTGENDPDAYLDAMEKNLETLKEALS